MREENTDRYLPWGRAAWWAWGTRKVRKALVQLYKRGFTVKLMEA